MSAGAIETTALEATAILLAGGRSRRMGTDKARLVIDGMPLLVRRVHDLAARFAEVLVVAPVAAQCRQMPIEGAGARWVEDGGVPGKGSSQREGPLAGLLGGLAAASHDRVYLTGVDLPELVWPLVRALLDRLDADPAIDVVSVHAPRPAPEHSTPNRSAPRPTPRLATPPAIEPLVAALRRSTQGRLTATFAAGERSLRRALTALPYAILTTVSSLDPEGRAFWNLNTPEDVARWRSR